MRMSQVWQQSPSCKLFVQELNNLSQPLTSAWLLQQLFSFLGLAVFLFATYYGSIWDFYL